MAFRPLTTAARKTLRIGLIPADGIGREVIPVSTNCQNVLFSIVLILFPFFPGRTQNIGSSRI